MLSYIMEDNRFRLGNFSLKDHEIKTKINFDRHISTRKIAKRLNVSFIIITGYDKWIIITSKRKVIMI